MKNIRINLDKYLFLLVMLFASFYIHASIDTSIDCDSLEFDWPDCSEPKVTYHVEDEHTISYSINNYDSSLKYEARYFLDHSSDTTYRVVYEKNVFSVNDNVSKYGIQIRAICSFGTSEWVNIKGDIDKRVPDCFPTDFFHHAFVENNYGVITHLAVKHGGPNSDYAPYINHHLKIQLLDINGGVYQEIISKNKIGDFIILSNPSEYWFYFGLDAQNIASIEVSIGDYQNCIWQGNYNGCSPHSHPALCSYSDLIVVNLPNYTVVPNHVFICELDYEVVCDFNQHIVGEAAGSNLRLKNNSLTQFEFDYLVTGLTDLESIGFEIKGLDQNGLEETSYVEFYNSNQNVLIEDWERTIPNFGLYTDLTITTQYYLNDGNGAQLHTCPSSNEIDLPLTFNPEICELADKIVGLTNNADVVINFVNFSNNDKEQLIDEFDINYLELEIWASNSPAGSTQNIILYLEDSAIDFNPESWNHTLLNYSGYDQIYVKINYKSHDILRSCDQIYTIDIVNPYCDLLTLLDYKVHEGTDVIRFSYWDVENPSKLAQQLAILGYDIGSANEFIINNVDNITFNFTYKDQDNVSYNESHSYQVVSSFDFSTFTFQFPLVDYESFIGDVDILYELNSNIVKICNVYQIQHQIDDLIPQQIPDLTCDASITDAVITDLTPLSISNDSLIGDVLTMNGLPFVISEITSGTNTSANGITGDGLLVLPFKNKRIFIHLNGVKVNAAMEGVSGFISGQDGPGIDQFPEFNLPPLLLGGPICLPPPADGHVEDGGYNPNTNLDGLGFRPDGTHHITNTQYDPNGYNKDGIHEDTGEKWNEDGCTRDGQLWAENEEGVWEDTGEACDHTGGNPPEPAFSEFIATKTQRIDTLINEIYEEIKSEHLFAKNGFDQDFDIKKANTPINFIEHQEAAFGMNNKLISKGMSEKFTSDLTSIGERDDAQWETLENNQIELLNIDKDLTKATERETIILEFESHKPDINLSIKNKLQELKANEFKLLQDDETYNNWVKENILLYIKEQTDYQDYVINEATRKEDYFYPEDNINSGYYDVASLNENAISKKDLKQNIDWQYRQGFEKINGVESPLVDQLVKKYQIEYFSTTTPVENLLPIHIKSEMLGYEVDLFLKDVEVYPMSAKLTGGAVVTNLKNKDEKIAIGATDVEFTAGGFKEGKLELKNEVKIRLLNSARLNFKPHNTYVLFDCHGYAGGKIESTIEFCENYIIALDSLDNPDFSKKYELDIEIEFGKNTPWMDFTVEVDANPFILTDYPQMKFKNFSFGIDMSRTKSTNLVATNIPLDYQSPHYTGTTMLPSWTGFYIKEITVDGKMFKKDFTVVAESLLFDNYGMSGYVGGGSEQNPLLASGSSKGWMVSLDKLYVLFLNNSIAGGGFGGDIGIPLLSNPLKYRAIITLSGNADLKIKVDETNKFTAFNSDVILKKNSYVQASYQIDSSDFNFTANLNGEIDFNAELDSTFGMPTVMFQRVRYTNNPGPNGKRFNPGLWGVKGAKAGEPLFNGGGLSIYKLALVGTDDPGEVALNVDLAISIADTLLYARGDILIIGEQTESNNLLSYKFKKIKVKRFCVGMAFKDNFNFSGCIEFFDKHTIYGDGFRGALDVNFKMAGDKNFGLMAAATFGKKANHRYYFVDLVVKGDFITIYEVITVNRLGGGLSNGMDTNFDGTKMHGKFVNNSLDYFNEPIGTTLTGTVYTPDSNAGITFKLFATFYAVKESLASGLVELVFRFNKGKFSMQSVELRGEIQIAKELSLTGNSAVPMDSLNLENADPKAFPAEFIPKKITAQISGVCDFKLNFDTKELKGFAAIYLTAGPLTGAGPSNALVKAEIFLGRDDWFFYLGEPDHDKRAGIELSMPLIDASLRTYFNVGTKIPPFPGLPPKISHLGRKIAINEAVRQSGKGFAFGADFNFDISLGSKLLGTGVFFSIGAGFDVMLKHYENPLCIMPVGEAFGINNWYALGQAWAYLSGSVKVAHVNILRGGIAAVLQIQGPNPTSIYANLEIIYGNKSKSVDFEIGEKCNFNLSSQEDPLSLDMFRYVDPGNNSIDVGLEAKVKVGLNFDISEEIYNYQIPGVQELQDLQFYVDENDSGIFDDYGKIEAKMDISGKSIRYTPVEFLYPNKTYYTKTKIIVVADINYTYEKIYTFYTSSEYNNIPEENVVNSYPINGMTNFYINESIVSKGFIKLRRPQYSIFEKEVRTNDQGESFIDLPYIKVTDASGNVFLTEAKYIPSSYEIQFDVPSAEMTTNSLYRLEIKMKKGINLNNVATFLDSNGSLNSSSSNRNTNDYYGDTDPMIYEMYFRSSMYPTFQSKFDAMNEVDIDLSSLNNQEITGRAGNGNPDKKYIYSFSYTIEEIFDTYELLGATNENSLVSFSGGGYTVTEDETESILFIHNQEGFPLEYIDVVSYLEYDSIRQIFLNQTFLSTGAANFEYAITKENFLSNSFDIKSGKQAIIFFNHDKGAGPGSNATITYRVPGSLLSKSYEGNHGNIGFDFVEYNITKLDEIGVAKEIVEKVINH